MPNNKKHLINKSSSRRQTAYKYVTVPEPQAPIFLEAVISILENPYTLESGEQPMEQHLHGDEYGQNHNPKQSNKKLKINELCIGF